MSNHGLTKENLLASFPLALRRDESAHALAAAIAELLSGRPEEINRLLIYPRIDQLDEEMLAILAYDFKVDWWDPEYSLPEKRQTVKDSWKVHKMLGTKAAVKLGISAVYPASEVLEWFQYGGEPYHFKLRIDASNDVIDLEKQRRVLKRLEFYKNLRSWNDSIEYFVDTKDPTIVGAGAAFLGTYTRYTVEIPTDGIVDWPRVQIAAHGGVATKGVYQKITIDITPVALVDELDCCLLDEQGNYLVE